MADHAIWTRTSKGEFQFLAFSGNACWLDFETGTGAFDAWVKESRPKNAYR